MVRIRTAEMAYREIKEQDPNSCISVRQIRDLMKSGKIPVHKVGKKLLVNMDILEQYYSDPSAFS